MPKVGRFVFRGWEVSDEVDEVEIGIGLVPFAVYEHVDLIAEDSRMKYRKEEESTI